MRVNSKAFICEAILFTGVLLHFTTSAATITSVSPAPGATLPAPPSSIVIDIAGSASLDPNSVNALTVQLKRAGADGVFGTADDVNVPVAFSISGMNQITLDLTGATLPQTRTGL